MLRLQNISFNVVEKNENVVNGPFWGLTFLESEWGEINRPIRISDSKELVDKIGEYNTLNENDFMQCYNFLAYSKQLKIFRLGIKSATPTFDGSNDLESAYGSLNSNLFIGSYNDGDTYKWNSVSNGSTLYLKINDIDSSYTLPTYNSGQLLFFAGKYAGVRGNEIGISIANYYTTTTTNIFTTYHEIRVDDASTYIVTDVITGDTSEAVGEIKEIKFDTLYVDVTSGEFEEEETIDTSTATISKIYDPVDTNYSFSELFDTSLNIDDIAIVITVGNKIKDKKICSLDITKSNYVELWENEWVNIYLPSTYVSPVSTDSESTIKDKVPVELLNDRLLFGTNSTMPLTYKLTQLEILKDPNKYDYDVLFVDQVGTTLETTLQDVIDNRNNCILIINKQEALSEDTVLLLDTDCVFLLDTDGSLIITE